MDGPSFAAIGLHKTDAASDWLLIKRHGIGTKGLPGVSMVTTLIHKRDFSIYRKDDVLFQPKYLIRGAYNFSQHIS